MQHPLVDAFLNGRGALKKEKGRYFDNLKNPRKACALGAIYYGLYKKTSEIAGDEIYKDYGEIRHIRAIYPCEDMAHLEGPISHILIHLNDEHDARTWGDKAIASWLDEALKLPVLA